MAELKANPEWVAQRAEQDRTLQERTTCVSTSGGPALEGTRTFVDFDWHSLRHFTAHFFYVGPRLRA